MFGVGGYVPVPVAALEEPDSVRLKSAAMIEDSDSGRCHFHLIVNTTTSHSLTYNTRSYVEIREFIVVVVCKGLPPYERLI